MKKGKLHNIGTILLIMVMVLTMIPFSAMAATATAIKFAKTSDMRATAGKNYKREAITTPESAEVTYSSNNKSIATVDENGRVTAVAEGKAVITSKSGKVTASYNVVVSKVSEVPTSTTRPLMSNQPKNGYATVAEAAKAWPGQYYYMRSMGLDARDNSIWRWWAVSYEDVIKNNPLYGTHNGTVGNYANGGFDAAEEVISIFGGEKRRSVPVYSADGTTIVFTTLKGNVIKSEITGKWHYAHESNLDYWFPTVEAAAKARGSNNAQSYNYEESYAKAWYPQFNMTKNGGPYQSKAEATNVAEQEVTKNRNSGDSYRYEIIQNKYTQKWFFELRMEGPSRFR